MAKRAQERAASAMVSEGSAPPEAGRGGTGDQKQSAEPWEKVRKLGLRHLRRLVSFEPRVVKGDDPDAIHDLRVASRRLQQVMDLLNPPPRPREVRWLRCRLRRCRRALSDVRNCDVTLALTEAALAMSRTPRREAWMAVRDYLAERRAQSIRKGLRKLRKVGLLTFRARCGDYIRSIGSGAAHAPRGVSQASNRPEQLCERMAVGLERFWSAFESKVAASHRDLTPLTLHAVRIAAKRLRYLIEVIHAFKVPGSAQALTWLRGVQQHLGDWHDLQVLEEVMIEVVARRRFLRERLELAMDIEKLILRNRLRKKGYESKYLEVTSEGGEIQRLKEWVDQVLASPPAALATVGGTISVSFSPLPSPAPVNMEA